MGSQETTINMVDTTFETLKKEVEVLKKEVEVLRKEKLACLAKIGRFFSRLLPRTILLDLDTGADDVTTSGPSYRC